MGGGIINIENFQSKLTSLQIAELSGKRHRDLIRSIRNMEKSWEKIAGRSFALGSYLDANNQERPMYELTMKESLYIATKFNDEARAKLILRWEELENNKRLDQELRLRELESKLLTSPDYFTIVGYANKIGQTIGRSKAIQIGRAASKICREKGFDVDKVNDTRYGQVNSYPAIVLEDLF